jgi:hypothetical protein
MTTPNIRTALERLVAAADHGFWEAAFDSGPAERNWTAAIAAARAALAEPEPGEVGELVDSLQCEAGNEEVYGNCAVITATELRRAADLLERLAPQPVLEVQP